MAVTKKKARCVLTVYCTVAERARLEKLAAEGKRTLSMQVRYMVFDVAVKEMGK